MSAASLTLVREVDDAFARDLCAALARLHPDVETPALWEALVSR